MKINIQIKRDYETWSRYPLSCSPSSLRTPKYTNGFTTLTFINTMALILLFLRLELAAGFCCWQPEGLFKGCWGGVTAVPKEHHIKVRGREIINVLS